MQVLSIVWGVLAILGFFVGVIPCLGWFNWLNIPFAACGLIFCIVAFAMGRPGLRTGSVAGIVLCSIAVLIGAKRLILGAGII